MVCPYCEHPDTKVVDKRESDAVSTRRRRECLDCHQRFTTYERLETIELVVAKHDGRREPFNSEKLRAGIELAIKKRPISSEQIDRLIDEVEAELRAIKGREIDSQQIGTLVMAKLEALDQVAYIRFASVYRDFADASSFQDEVSQLLASHRPKH
ncbi:MAG TPA: transcriptional regulator NrdR [Candidatus Saccharimonadia bacterium]|nr:transcriptional regulator NrdR [Candidatus Saccharimonadia bacterium]